MFDFNDTEACHLSEIYDDYEGYSSYQEYIAESEYRRANTIATIAGIDDRYYARKKVSRKQRKAEIERKDRLNRAWQKKDLFVIIQDSRRDGTTLMLVDRRKSKEYWWTHDFSLAYKGKREDMEKAARKLHRNNVRVVSYKTYFNNL
jgi:hypothetical protein|nr:MAG TPA: hypothetical protein [Caudoviricetes sp.]